jgi:CRISPR-associated endonuclease Csn1
MNNNLIRKRVLGLDLGTSSIGWALVDTDIQSDDKSSYLHDCKILGLGVRIFPESVEPKTKTLLNIQRREKRGIRKLYRRRRSRTISLIYALQHLQFLPAGIVNSTYIATLGEAISKDVQYKSPYELRTKALTQKLELFELGYAIFHLAQRRGFKSNAKRNPKDGGENISATINNLDVQINQLNDQLKNEPDNINLKKEKEVLAKQKAALEETGKEYRQSGCETIGMWLNTLPKKRNKMLIRSDIKEECNKILLKQSEFYKVLNDNTISNLNNIIFHQRPLKDCSHLVKFCTFEKNERCISKAHYLFQQFSVLQDINNLEYYPVEIITESKKTYTKRIYTDPDTGEIFTQKRSLDNNSRKAIYDELIEKGSVSQKRILEIANLKNYDSDFWKGSKKTLELPTIKKFIEIVGHDNWKSHQSDFMSLYFIYDDREFNKKLDELTNKLKLDADIQNQLRNLELKHETKYSDLSQKALEKLLPLMLNGKKYYEAATAVYGSHSSIATVKWNKNYLPSLIELDLLQQDLINNFANNKNRDYKFKIKYVPSINNHTVIRALTELRKVVNAIIRDYCNGDPTQINEVRIETARDLALSSTNRSKLTKQMEKNQEKNAQRAQELETNMHLNANGTNIIKYRLWQETGKLCAYCGQTISKEIFVQRSDIEHIIPLSQLADDSLENKTIACTECNHEKSNKTPYEAWRRTGKWEKLLDRYNIELDKRSKHYQNNPKKPYYSDIKMSSRKIKRILADDIKEFKNQFSLRQLNDTRYIATQAVDYLRILFKDIKSDKKDSELVRKVNTVKGMATAILRQIIIQDKLLFQIINPSKNNSEDKQENENQPPTGTKHRNDHRHHAIDAVCIALSGQTLIQRITKYAQQLSSKSDSNSKFKICDYFDEDTLDVNGEKLSTRIMKQMKNKIANINVSYKVEHKLSGAFHEETVYGVKTDSIAINYLNKYLFDKLLQKQYITDTVGKQLGAWLNEYGKYTDAVINERKVVADDPYLQAVSRLKNNPFVFVNVDGIKFDKNKIPLLKPLYIKRVKILDAVKNIDDILDNNLKNVIKKYADDLTIVEDYNKKIPKKYENDSGCNLDDMTDEQRQLLCIDKTLGYIKYEELKQKIVDFKNKQLFHPISKLPIHSVQQWVFESRMFTPKSAPYKAMPYGNNHHVEIYYCKIEEKDKIKYHYIKIVIPQIHAAELVRTGKLYINNKSILGIKGSPYLGGKNKSLQQEWVNQFGTGIGKQNVDLNKYQFLCFLHNNDIVEKKYKGTIDTTTYYRVRSFDANGVIIAQHQLVSGIDPNQQRTLSIKIDNQELQNAIPIGSAMDEIIALINILPSGKIIRQKLPIRPLV